MWPFKRGGREGEREEGEGRPLRMVACILHTHGKRNKKETSVKIIQQHGTSRIVVSKGDLKLYTFSPVGKFSCITCMKYEAPSAILSA